MTTQFPFGIDPTRFVPDSEGPLTVEVEGIGSHAFPDGNDSVVGMASQVVANVRGHAIIRHSTSSYLSVTDWNPEERKLTVKLTE